MIDEARRTDARPAWRGLFGSLALLSLASGAGAQTPGAGEASAEHLLLKDYRPRVIHELPRTTTTRARFPVIDMHSHPYAHTPEDVDRWVLTMDALGIEKTIVMTGASGERFREYVELFRRHPGRFSPWCGLDYSGFDRPGYGPAAVAALERAVADGAEGVGELSDKGRGLRGGGRDPSNPDAWGMHVDDPRLDALLERCADLGLPVNVHVGDPRWVYEPMDGHNDGLMNALEWRLDDQSGILGLTEVVATLDRAASRHPRTTFIACHFANCTWDLSILGRMLDEHPNLYADIGARYAETATIPRRAAAFFAKYRGRLLYGTDMGFAREMYLTTFRILETADEHFYDFDLFDYHWPLYGLALDDDVLEKVYAANARRILAGRGSR
jgi:predicted TIM-barrel fold metal-dependent hydrolase